MPSLTTACSIVRNPMADFIRLYKICVNVSGIRAGAHAKTLTFRGRITTRLTMGKRQDV
jgi:hypothetical protein